MKANELMIWDLVLFLGHIHQIRAIEHKPEDNFSTIKFYGKNKVITTTNEVEPIPLTTAILEKNGFTHRNADKILTKQSWTCECGGCTIHAKYNFGFLYFNIYGKPLKPNMFAPHVTMHIQYAHELQHILKDCHIDKEIVL